MEIDNGESDGPVMTSEELQQIADKAIRRMKPFIAEDMERLGELVEKFKEGEATMALLAQDILGLLRHEMILAAEAQSIALRSLTSTGDIEERYTTTEVSAAFFAGGVQAIRYIVDRIVMEIAESLIKQQLALLGKN
jgi:hypothetical protein